MNKKCINLLVGGIVIATIISVGALMKKNTDMENSIRQMQQVIINKDEEIERLMEELKTKDKDINFLQEERKILFNKNENSL